MHRSIAAVVLTAAATFSPSAMADVTLNRDDLPKIDAAIEKHIAAGDAPGAVLLIGNATGTLYEKAYGDKSVEPTKTPMTTDTIFDLASLSKSIGCATSIMVLVDQGKIDVHEPITTYVPSMNNNGKDKVTVEQCLLHTAGFVPDNPMSDYTHGVEAAWTAIDHIDLRSPPGEKFAYSDVGFEVLGRIVEKVSGQPLDQFAKEHVFKPLKMSDTTYNPPKDWFARIAPTEKRNGKPIVGEVHDPRAYALGGVAGHAGVFGTASDVARWCRMLLNDGELDGVRVLKPETVHEMLTMRTLPDGSNGRGYGVDFTSNLAPSPRGKRFEPGKTFGHTGWTGTMYWIDPEHDVFVVLLTSRCHPDGKGDVKEMRREVSTLVAEALLGPKE